jgi:hypothetical protein
MAYKLLDYQSIAVNDQGETDTTMFHMQRIVRKLKGIRLKPESKRKEGVRKNSPAPVDEIGYEASYLMSQEHHGKEDMKP